LKIAHITTVHPQNDNRIFYKECKTLADAGYDVSLIVAGTESKNIDGIQIIGFEKEKGRLKRFIKTSFFDLLAVCHKVDADIYHFHDPEIIFAGLVLKIRGKKVIFDIHENNPASIMSKPYINPILRKSISKSMSILEWISIKFFDAIVTARPDISKRFQHKNMITLRNFPILPDFKKLKEIKIEKNKPSVIFVGGMTKIRGICELLNAFKDLPEYELWLLGPILDNDLKIRIEQSSNNIKYFGIVEAYEVFSFIQQADIGIITFLSAPNHLSTMATKPFEYMACGKPMIMSNFEYWKETFGNSSLYVDPSDSNDIKNTIRKLMSNNIMIEEMSLQNKKLAYEEYNWSKESQKLIKLYKELENKQINNNEELAK